MKQILTYEKNSNCWVFGITALRMNNYNYNNYQNNFHLIQLINFQQHDYDRTQTCVLEDEYLNQARWDLAVPLQAGPGSDRYLQMMLGFGLSSVTSAR